MTLGRTAGESGAAAVRAAEFDQAGFRAAVRPDGDGVLLRLHGVLGAGAEDEVLSLLTELLTGAARVVADLTELSPDGLAHLQVFAAALDRAGGWPAAELVLVVPDGPAREALAASGVSDLVVVVDSLSLARIRGGHRPRLVRAAWDFDPDPRILATARELIRSRLALWQAPVDPDDLVLAATELLANVVDHAGTPLRLGLAFDGRAVRLEVRDGSPRPPTLRPFDPGAARGRGLQMVQAVTDEWDWSEGGWSEGAWSVGAWSVGGWAGQGTDRGPRSPGGEGKTVWARVRASA